MKINNQPFYLMPVDGAEYFGSEKVHGPCCLKKEHKKSGKTSYYHQMLTGAIVHHNLKTVIPFSPIAIVAQDGSKKQDSEGKAFKRYMSAFKKNHPKLKVIICGDTLYANAPLVANLKQDGLGFILGILTAIPELLEKLDIKGKFVSMDATGCQIKIAKKIR